ncbi:DUF3888 domain-containing protein [Paenibacillus sp. FSL L8-0696]|uniref:DUF3888 domain-containing protein n=1 Tax=Paenibacillus sp. FSL L8-0696 TaxID=2954524 RepID=UPI00311A735E
MKKSWIAPLLVAVMLVLTPQPCSANRLIQPQSITPSRSDSGLQLPDQDSRELEFQDMLMLFLLPHIEKKIADIYSPLLRESPMVYPYFVDVTEVKRLNGFRGFDFLITLNVYPSVGPHISVGEDTMTFRISPGPKVKLESFKHLKDPQKSDFPPNYQNILR